MGVFRFQSETNKVVTTKPVKILPSLGVRSVAVDAEYVIGKLLDLDKSPEKLNQNIKAMYIDIFINNNVSVYFVFGGKPVKQLERIKKNRINDILKLKKNVFKAHINQKIKNIQDEFLAYLWDMVELYFYNNPLEKDDPFYIVYNTIFVEKNPSNILNKKTYSYYMTKLGGYVWDKNDILFKLFEKFIVNLEPVTHDIINSLPYSILWKIAYKHWNGKMARKRLETHIYNVKQYLQTIVPIVESTYDGDDQLVMMVELGIVDGIVSGDSDFFAYRTNMVIVDIDNFNETVTYVKISDLYNNFKLNGYTEDMIKNAMIISSADYNYYLCKKKIPFNVALEASIDNNGNVRNYYKLFYYFCQKENLIYNNEIAEEISKAYNVSTNEDDIKDSLYAIVNSIHKFISCKNTKYFNHIYFNLIEILLLFIINNNILNIKIIKEYVNTLKNNVFFCLNKFTLRELAHQTVEPLQYQGSFSENESS